MKIGYFKLPPPHSPKVLPSNKKSLLLPLPLPVSGLLLGLVLITGIQIGYYAGDRVIASGEIRPSIFAGVDFSSSDYQSLVRISLPASVSFLPNWLTWLEDKWGSFIDTVLDFFYQIKQRWFNFFNFSTPTPPAGDIDVEALRGQIKNELLSELAIPNQDLSLEKKQGYGVMVVPASTTATDEDLKSNLRQIFADQVRINFSADGLSGRVTPVFRDIGQGQDYVFVLNPLNK